MPNSIKKNNRTQNAAINSVVGIASYFIAMIANFAFRTVFIYFLSVEYLGIQALLTNILSLLSLAEMGVGSAMIFSLYRPIARNEISKIRALLQLYKKMYRIIAVLIFVLGLLLTPFLNFFIASRPSISEPLEVIFLLYVANTAFTYLSIHKHSILQADQRAYIVTLWTNFFMILRYIAQILWIIIFKSFIPILIIQLILTLMGNIFVSKKAEKSYPFIKETNEDDKISNLEMKSIVNKIQAMLLYRVGSYAVNSTDSIIISKFVGLVSVGIYSNYTMLLGLANSIINFISSALTPSIGNQIESQSSNQVHKTFSTLYFIFFWISSITTISFSTLLNPFIELWIGEKYLVSSGVLCFLIINYYIMMMRRVMVAYRNALGLYEIAKYKPIYEALINLIASLILVRYFGMMGVIIGTTISDITTSLWIEPYVMYKHFFIKGLKQYWIKYIIYAIFTSILSVLMITFRNFFYTGGVVSLIFIFVAILMITNIFIWLLFRNSEEFKETTSRIKSMINLGKR